MVIMRMNPPVTFSYMKGQFYSRYFISPLHILLSCHFKSEQHFIFPFTATCRIKYLSQIRKKIGKKKKEKEMLNAGKGYNSIEINRSSALSLKPLGLQIFLLLVHCGYSKLVQHDFISFQALPEKTKLQNQSYRRSEWDFITSIACLHEYLSFMTDPICHNSCLVKIIHFLKLMYYWCRCYSAGWADYGEVLKKKKKQPLELHCRFSELQSFVD